MHGNYSRRSFQSPKLNVVLSIDFFFLIKINGKIWLTRVKAQEHFEKEYIDPESLRKKMEKEAKQDERML